MDKIHWGIIGCGGIARKRTLPGFLLAKIAECTAVMDPDPQVLLATGSQFGIEKRYSDANALLADPGIDAVYIASPVHAHKEQVFAAADAGKHILVEKPMALTVRNAAEMEAYCAARGVRLGVGFMMRFHGVHEEIRRLIAGGSIGEVVTAYAVFNTDFPAVPGNWRQTKATGGGGAMMDMGIHCIDLLHYMTGLKPAEVTAICGRQIHAYPDIEDAASAVMRMNNGALFTVQANFNVPTEAGGCSIVIMGTNGSLTAQNTLGQTSTGTLYSVCLSGPSAGAAVLPYDTGNMYAKELDAFSDAIRTGAQPPVGARDCILAQKTVEAAYESSETGKHVRVL